MNFDQKYKPKFIKFIKKSEFQNAFELLIELEKPLNNFFESTTINDKNKKLRQNRLLILAEIRFMILSIADFSKIELGTSNKAD